MRHLTFLLVLAASCALAGCGGGKDSWDKVDTERIAALKEMKSILQSVKDEPSAKAAADKLKAKVAAMKKLQARADKLPMPSQAEMKRIMDKHGEPLKAAEEALRAEGLRIQLQKEWTKHIEPVMLEINSIRSSRK